MSLLPNFDECNALLQYKSTNFFKKLKQNKPNKYTVYDHRMFQWTNQNKVFHSDLCSYLFIYTIHST